MENKRNNFNEFNISPSIINKVKEAEEAVKKSFSHIESIREQNQLKVIRAMQMEKLSDTHFSGTTGYGYNDRGREILDAVFAHAFGSEDVRPT